MFSDTVQLADINDFITLEQECVIQTGGNVMLDTDSLMDDDIGSVKLRNKKNNNAIGHFDQIVTDKSNNTAKITLDDCLACSGCITSAETVLINQQSISQMESYLKAHQNATLCVTVSNQAVIAIAKRYQMDPTLASQRIAEFFKKEYGARFVFNCSIALEIVMKEAIHEFITNYKERFLVDDNTSTTNDQESSMKMDVDVEEKDSILSGSPSESRRSVSLPILCSECPGFVCYAEKSCKPIVLENISNLKSPQQIMGLLIKKYFNNHIARRNAEQGDDGKMDLDDSIEVYHVTVMPCYDKKLEGARKEFVIENDTNNKEVDCVITSIEIEQLLTAKGVQDLSQFDISTEITGAQTNGMDDILQFITDNNGVDVRTEYVSELIADDKGSHGYLENIFIAAAKELFGIHLRPNTKDFKYKKLRNEDVEELTLTLTAEQMRALPFRFKDKSMERTGRVLRFFRCYGFRNIQNVIRQIERRKSKYHYVEIMACPAGCINGGGQIRLDSDDPESKKMSKQREHVKEMRKLLHRSQVIDQINKKYDGNKKTKMMPIADAVYQQILQQHIGQNQRLTMELHHIDQTKANSNIKW